jgi:ISXO2 transposase-like protein/transposase-like zinc ribbon protein
MNTLAKLRSKFNSELACMEHLANIKWKHGYNCCKCGHSLYYKGQRNFDRKCQECQHNESPTTGTLFHKIKFPLVKAFEMIYWITETTKGMSTVELSKHFDLQQKTCWLFKRKIQEAMNEKGSKLDGFVEIDEFIQGGSEVKAQGRACYEKKMAIVGIQTVTTKKGKKGIKKAFCKMIDGFGAQDLRPFLEEKVDGNSNIKTDKWSGYLPLKKDFKIKMVYSKLGENFKELHHFIMNLKGWIRGIHHSVSFNHYQNYLDEFCFRFNNQNDFRKPYNMLIENMISHSPMFSRNIPRGN